MPKHDKKRHVSESDSDSGPDDKNPSPAKKEKSSKHEPPMENGEPTWELGQNKKVKVQINYFTDFAERSSFNLCSPPPHFAP